MGLGIGGTSLWNCTGVKDTNDDDVVEEEEEEGGSVKNP